MSVIPDLFAAYRDLGYVPVTGHNPAHFEGWRDAPFTSFLKDGNLVGIQGLGLALQEIMFLDGLGPLLAPANILVIGNSFGWSTIALSLIFPKARVLAIDPQDKGNALTAEIAGRRKLDVVAAAGSSPQDVAPLVGRHLAGKPDLVLIDAVHNNEALVADFAACRAVAADNALYLLHDVMNWNMGGALDQIVKTDGLKAILLTRTASGMAAVWRDISPDVLSYLTAFADPPEFYKKYRQAMIDGFVRKVPPQA